MHATRDYAPWAADPSGGIVEFVSSCEICGITVWSAENCSPAAHALPAWGSDEKGLFSATAYDALGRPFAAWDSLVAPSSAVPASELATPATYEHWTYARYEPPLDSWDFSPWDEGQPAAAFHRVNRGTLASPIPVWTRTWQDGFGRPLQTRSDWISDDATSFGQRVDGVARRDSRDLVVRAWAPCFEPGVWDDADDWVLPAGDPCPVTAASGDPTPEERLEYDPVDRPVLHVRADGSRIETRRYSVAGAVALAGMPSFWLAGSAERSELYDSGNVLLQAQESVVGPRARRTIREMAETWQDVPAPAGPPTEVQPGPSELTTWEILDPFGHAISVFRDGWDSPSDTTSFFWDGHGQVRGWLDPDRGNWSFDFDRAGRATVAKLSARGTGSPESWTRWVHDEKGRKISELQGSGASPLQVSERWDWTWDGDPALAPLSTAPGIVQSIGSLASVRHSSWQPAGCASGPGPHLASPRVDIEQDFLHDARGRAVEMQQEVSDCEAAPLGVGRLSMQFEYFEDGGRSAYRLPEGPGIAGPGEWVQTLRDGAGKEIGLAGDQDYLADSTYDAWGRPRTLWYGNGLTEDIEYAPSGEGRVMERLRVSRAWDEVWLDRAYDWDGAGNLRGWSETSTLGLLPDEAGICGYDGLGALQWCEIERSGDEIGEGHPGDDPSGIARMQWRYDVLGDLIREDVQLPSGNRQGFQYFARDRATLLPAAGGVPSPPSAPVGRVELGNLLNGAPQVVNARFDARGQMIEQSFRDWPASWASAAAAMTEDGLDPSLPVDAVRSFSWDGRGKLKAVSVESGGGGRQRTARYLWDESGGRVAEWQWDPALSADVVQLRMAGVWDWTDRAGERDFTVSYRLGGRLLAQRDLDVDTVGLYGSGPEEIRYVVGDHLGSTSLTTDGAGDVRIARRYEPYGRKREEAGPDAGAAEQAPGDVEERFNGKQRELGAMGFAGSEWELEAYDYGARWYLPMYGAWGSADAVTPDSVWEANPYAYVRGNPLKYVDPTGNGLLSAAVKIVRGVLKGGDLALTFKGVVDDWNTLTDVNASPGEHLLAGFSLASEILPVSAGDLADGARVVREAVPDLGELRAGVGAVADSVGRRIDGDAVSVAGGGSATVTVSRAKYPQAAGHIEEAQAAGKPSTLTIDRGGASARRGESLSGTDRVPGKDRDEYPGAMFKEGGGGASVRPIDPRDNRGAGACVGGQCRGLPDGSTVEIKVTE